MILQGLSAISNRMVYRLGFFVNWLPKANSGATISSTFCRLETEIVLQGLGLEAFLIGSLSIRNLGSLG
jgi:hypothetical protein